jgi:hypothetical protein
MLNPLKEINWTPEAKDLRKFALSLIIGFPCIALVFFYVTWFKSGAQPAPDFFLKLGGIGALVGLICLLVPIIARPLYYIWYAIAGVMGLIMGNLIFGLMFYALFTPIGLVMKLIGRDPLQLKPKKTTTYWLDAPPSPPAASYFSQH